MEYFRTEKISPIGFFCGFLIHYFFQTKTYCVHLHAENSFFNSGKKLLATLTDTEKKHTVHTKYT